jgi:tRNA pseudouridine synthase B (EC 4.2.1.70)
MMNLNGVINVLKPPGMTSSDVVVTMRKKLNIKKVGHTGTLDPAAAGVLPICIGKATKLAEYITSERKIYRAEMVLGIETDTLDADGRVIARSANLPSIQEIQEVFDQYQGIIKQKPPIYSAIKHKGKRLYELAREGQNVDISSREVVIYKNRIIQFIYPNRVFL